MPKDTIRMMHEHLLEGDYVVGSYDKHGHQTKAGGIFGESEVINEYRENILKTSARAKDVAPLTRSKGKGKKGRPPKKQKPVKERYTDEEYVPPLNQLTTLDEVWDAEQESYVSPVSQQLSIKHELKAVTIHNDFGSIKLYVEAILECEMAFCLVFNSTKDLIFTPKEGQTLNLTLDDNRTFTVYYPNCLFGELQEYLVAPGRRFMVLFKYEQLES